MLERHSGVLIPAIGMIGNTGYRILPEVGEYTDISLTESARDLLYLIVKRWKDTCSVLRIPTSGVFLCLKPLTGTRIKGDLESLEMFFDHHRGEAFDISLGGYWQNGEWIGGSAKGYKPEYVATLWKVIENLEYSGACQVSAKMNLLHVKVSSGFI